MWVGLSFVSRLRLRPANMPSLHSTLLLNQPTAAAATGDATPQRSRAGVVPAVPLLEKPAGDRPHTRYVEQQSVPRVVVGSVVRVRAGAERVRTRVWGGWRWWVWLLLSEERPFGL